MLVKSAAASKQQRIAPSAANARSSTTISRLTIYSNYKDGKMVGGCWQPIQEETLRKAHHQTPRWLKQRRTIPPDKHHSMVNWFESIWLGNNNIQQSTTVMDSDAAIITNIVEISAIIDLNDVGLCHPS